MAPRAANRTAYRNREPFAARRAPYARSHIESGPTLGPQPPAVYGNRSGFGSGMPVRTATTMRSLSLASAAMQEAERRPMETPWQCLR